MSIAKGLTSLQDSILDVMNERFDKVDAILLNHSTRLDRIERDLAEVKNKLYRLDVRTDQDDNAIFSDIDKLRVKIARLEKEVKILKLKQSGVILNL